MVTERTTKQIIQNFNEKTLTKGCTLEEYKDLSSQVWVLKEDYEKREIELKYHKCPCCNEIKSIQHIIEAFKEILV